MLNTEDTLAPKSSPSLCSIIYSEGGKGRSPAALTGYLGVGRLSFSRNDFHYICSAKKLINQLIEDLAAFVSSGQKGSLPPFRSCV